MSASLFDLLENPEEFLNELSNLGLDGTIGEFVETLKNGIAGSSFNVEVDGEVEEEGAHYHPHSHEHPHHGHCSHRHGRPVGPPIIRCGDIHFHLHINTDLGKCDEYKKHRRKRHQKKQDSYHKKHRHYRGAKAKRAVKKRRSSASDMTSGKIRPRKH